MQISWSGLGSLAHCGQQYNLRYNEHLQKPPSGESLNMTIGSMVHQGFSYALAYFGENGLIDHLEDDAAEGVLAYYRAHLRPDKTCWDYENNDWVPDTEYYQMMEDAYNAAQRIVKYYVGRLGIGTRYFPVRTEDLGLEAGEWMVEWDFYAQLPSSDVVVHGFVDAVLWDAEYEQHVVVDWKTRTSFVDPTLQSHDGQLQLYAAVLNNMLWETGTAPIRQALYIQLRQTTPKPAKINKDGTPSKAQSDSTWEVWSKSVELLGIDTRLYFEIMQSKLKLPSDYISIVEVPITQDSSHQAITSVAQHVYLHDFMDTSGVWPRHLSEHHCKFCEFKRICDTERYGGDVATVIEREYEERTGD